MNHFPWHNGVLTPLERQIGQKSIKAKCGKRVAFNLANPDAVTSCFGCLDKLKSRLTYNRKWQKNLRDAKAKRLKREMLAHGIGSIPIVQKTREELLHIYPNEER